jgi:hypothetical protein
MPHRMTANMKMCDCEIHCRFYRYVLSAIKYNWDYDIALIHGMCNMKNMEEFNHVN